MVKKRMVMGARVDAGEEAQTSAGAVAQALGGLLYAATPHGFAYSLVVVTHDMKEFGFSGTGSREQTIDMLRSMADGIEADPDARPPTTGVA